MNGSPLPRRSLVLPIASIATPGVAIVLIGLNLYCDFHRNEKGFDCFVNAALMSGISKASLFLLVVSGFFVIALLSIKRQRLLLLVASLAALGLTIAITALNVYLDAHKFDQAFEFVNGSLMSDIFGVALVFLLLCVVFAIAAFAVPHQRPAP